MRGRIVGAAAALMVGALTLPVAQAVTGHPSTTVSLQSLLDTPKVDLPLLSQLASVSCPVERGPVKEGSDADRFKVSTSVVKTSVSYLRARPKPTSYPKNSRVTAAELHTYQVTAYLTQYKVEADGDIHLVLKDASGRSMIAEIPFGSCVPGASRWRSAIASTRASFVARHDATTSWHYAHQLVDVRGIGFMDPPHGQTGAAPDGLELHPVIYLHVH